MQKIACIPAYNEEKSIHEVVKDSFQFVDKVIVCDDGSNDKTAEEAKKAGASVITHKKNSGKGSALRSLFDYAKEIKFDVLITIDGDGQFFPKEIPKLITPITENGYDVVIGNRANGKTEMPKYRKFGNAVLDKMTNAASELPFNDTQSGFRAYSKKAIQQIKFLSDGYASDSEILIDASKKGLRITEEKIQVNYNTEGKTSTKHPVTHSSGVIIKLIELIAVKSPLKYLGIPGALLVILGIYYAGVVISIFNETDYFSIPTSLIALGSFVIGLVLLLGSLILVVINISLRR